jgi:hypothetical protein
LNVWLNLTSLLPVYMHTIGVKHLPQKFHRRWRQRIIPREFKLGGENAALERRAFGPLDQGLPVQEVVLAYRPRRDAFRRVVCQGAIFLEETAVGCRLCHFFPESIEPWGWGRVCYVGLVAVVSEVSFVLSLVVDVEVRFLRFQLVARNPVCKWEGNVCGFLARCVRWFEMGKNKACA